MKAAVYYENGPPSVFKYEDVADPPLMSTGIVIRVEAVSIEGGDTLNRLGGALFSLEVMRVLAQRLEHMNEQLRDAVAAKG